MITLAPLETYLAISDLERSAGVALRRVDEIQRLIGLRRRARILDAGAGQGWYSFLLAREHEVVAIDSSRWLIDRARDRAAALSPPATPELIVAPSESLPLDDGSIDVVVSLSGSIGHGSEDADRSTFCELRRTLAPDGRLLLETMHAEAAEARRERLVTFPAGFTVSYAPKFDRARQELRETQVLAHWGVDLGRFEYTMRIYDVSQLLEGLQAAGFATPALYGGTDGSRLTPSSEVVFVAQPRQPVFSAAFAHRGAGS